MSRRYILGVADAKGDLKDTAATAGLAFLRKKGFRTPETYVCIASAHSDYLANKERVSDRLRTEMESVIDQDKQYSVTPSVNQVGTPLYSLAGQLKGYSGLKNSESIITAIEQVWDSTRDLASQGLRIVVIIQETVGSKSSGVVFTKNPVTGLDEVVVEAGPKPEASAQAEAGLERWVYKWGAWIQKPHHEDQKLSTITDLVIQAKKIAEKFGKPASLQWVHDGKEIYWLQLREIKLRKVSVYSNRIAKEFLPGIIKPLVWSVNIPVVNSSWKRLFEELIGDVARSIDINNLAKSFYYRAYFNMGVVGDMFELLGMPREALELLMGIEVAGAEKPTFRPSAKTLRYLPRMILFALRKSVYSKTIENFLTTQREKYQRFDSMNTEKMDDEETLRSVEDLFEANKEASYFVIVSQLLNGFYNMMLKRQLEKAGVTLELDIIVRERLRDIDPTYHLSVLHAAYLRVPKEVRHKIVETSYDPRLESWETRTFLREFKGFLSKFGHLSDSGNDFSRKTWQETPDVALQMVTGYSPKRRVRADMEIGILSKSPLTRYLLGKAIRYGEYRDRVNFVYTYGYGLFRRFFLHIGELFTEKGFLKETEDIFYLTYDEIKGLVRPGIDVERTKNSLEKRKAEIEKYKNVKLPDRIYGDALPRPLMERTAQEKLKGVPTSRGRYIGRIRVVKSLRDSSKVRKGDVLAIPYSDVSWTPLFSKAKAVVSASGGMLSHCSIVAREYGIPAVVSVTGITELEDDTLVVVDGYSGEISIIERPKAPAKT